MRLKFYYTLIALLWLAIPLSAQDATVSGTVKDDSGAPLPGVNILIKGSTAGTTTDINGKYSLSAAPNATLIFSFIGFLSEEVAIENRTAIDVMLITDITTLSELIVVGYGVQEKKDITGAVSVVGAEALESRPNTQFGNLIQGKTAGVQVITPSGKPSAGFSIRVRGTTSITAGSEPLYVVDGVPTTDTRTINPQDIDNISVLKDASSAAIYGAQGANGVVLITTKRGKTGAPRFDFNAYAGFSQPWNTLKVLNSEQYRDLMTEMGMTTDWSQYTENTDWQNKVFQNGRSQNYQLSISGKTDKTNYYISGGWTEQKGAVRSSEMDRYNFKVNLEQRVNDWILFGTNFNYMRYHDVDVNDNNAINQGGVILGMLSTPPNIGVFRANGTYTSNPFQDWENPLASTDAADLGYLNQRVLGNLYGELNLLPELKFRTNVGINFSNGLYDYFLDPFTTSYGRAKVGIGRNNTNLHNYAIWDNTLTYSKTINDHVFTVLAGSVMQKNRWENTWIETNGFTGTGIPTTNGGSTIVSAGNNKEETTNASFISRVTYDYKSKYLFTGNFRIDGSSKFGENNRYGYFPAFSLGWRLSEEQFLSSAKNLFDDLKLRFGYGIVGNDDLPRKYGWVGVVSPSSNYPVGSVIQPGTYQSTIENKDLKWEETEQFNIGLDAAVLGSRLTLTVEAYVKNTYDLLLDVPLPRSTGFDVGIQNIGKMRNKGLEFMVSSVNLDGDIKWNTDVNFSINRNEVVELKREFIQNGGIPSRDEVSYTTVGQPLAMFYGYVWGGVDPETGMAYYIDKNGESTFAPSPEDRVFIGNPHPDFYYGMTNTVSYKNFDLSLFIQGVQGNDVFNATRVETEGMSDAKNQTIAVARRWRQVGDVTDIPKATPNNTDNSRVSTRFVEDGSFVRVKALTLGYNVPKNVLTKVRLSNAKIYVTGENLFTITNYSGYDPEVNAYGGSNTAMGIDFGTYPQTRNLIFGVNLSF
jgi:TonB-dependent starch-binding outer membrane protein SusC